VTWHPRIPALTEGFDRTTPRSRRTLYARYERCELLPGHSAQPTWRLLLATSYDEVRSAALDSKTFSSANGVYLPAVAEHRCRFWR